MATTPPTGRAPVTGLLNLPVSDNIPNHTGYEVLEERVIWLEDLLEVPPIAKRSEEAKAGLERVPSRAHKDFSPCRW